MKKRIKIFNKGFTLIELLAVIVVLAIILVIAMPRIMNVIEESQKEALKLSAKNIEKSARDRLQMSQDLVREDKTYSIIDGQFVGDSIPLSGALPKNGTIFVRSDGDVGLALSDGKFCLIKNESDDEMIVTKDIDNCVLVVETPSYCFDYWEVSDTEIEIIGYNRYDCPLDVIIPKKIYGKTVVEIGAGAFDNQVQSGRYKKDEKVVAYNGQVGLNEGDLLAAMVSDQAYHERSMRSITSVVIPNTVKRIEREAFRYNLLKSITIPDSVEYIGDFAFEYNELENIDIASSVTEIQLGAFNDNLLPDDQAFIYARNQDGSINNNKLISYGGSRNTNVIIPSNIKIIGEYAFYSSQLDNIIIPNTVEIIEDYAFDYNDIKTIQIPQGVEILEDSISYSFYSSYNDYYGKIAGTYSASCQDCTWKYSTLDAPPIPTSCFTTWNYGPSEVSIEKYNLRCPKDVVIPTTIGSNTVVVIDSNAFYNLDVVSVVIPNTIREIAKGAFEYNRLKNLTIPSSVTTIGYYAFSDNQLTNLTIPSNVITIDNRAFSYNELTSLTLNNGIKNIGEYAFSENKLTGIVIPNSVTSIGSGAFSDNKLTSLTIGSGIQELDWGTFSYNSLTSITIPSTLKKIGFASFLSNKLTSVTIPSTVTEISGGAFNDNLFPDSTALIYKRNSDGSINNTELVSYAGTKKENIIIPNNVTAISEYAFYETQLKSVTIPNSVTTIGMCAFQSNQLTSITIPNGVTKLETQTFYGNQLTSVTFPNNLSEIGHNAFIYNRLTNISIPNTVTTIGTTAFGSNQLVNVTLSTNLTSINSSTFANNNLTNIVIPNSVTSIGYNAFGNNQLTKVTIPSNVEVQDVVGWQSPSISQSFYTSYVVNNNQAGGLYTAPSQNGTWTKQP